MASPIYGLVLPTKSSDVQVSSEDLCCLLGNRWLSNWNIDPIIHLINRFAAGDSISTRALSLSETMALSEISREDSVVTTSLLADLELEIKSGHVTRILAPAFVNSNHFTLFSINFMQHTYAYADSLSSSATLPKRYATALGRWAKHVSNHPFTAKNSPSFTLPPQNDTFSCGVVVLSAIASIMIESPAWSKQHADLFRLLWFAWSLNPDYEKVIPIILHQMRGFKVLIVIFWTAIPPHACSTTSMRYSASKASAFIPSPSAYRSASKMLKD